MHQGGPYPLDEQDKAERRQEVHDAGHAKRLVEDPMLAGVWDAYDNHLRAAWEATEGSQSPLREQIFHRITASKHVRRRLFHAIETGELAAEQLNTDRDNP